MGIAGLESFSRNFVENGLRKFNILDEIVEWKKRNNDKHPVILIDIEKIFNAMAQSCIQSLILGGRLNIYQKNLDAFFKKLLTLGVNLVFFERGMEKHDFDFFAKHEEKEYEMYVNQLTEIDVGTHHERGTWMTDNYWMSLSTELKQIAEKYGKFYLTFNDHNQDIAAYAITHENVLAIWNRDSDFLLFHATSNIQYWSLAHDHLDFINFTTHRFDHATIHKSLMLSDQQVSMFGAILHFYYNSSEAAYRMKAFFHDSMERSVNYKWNILESKRKSYNKPNISRIRSIAEFVHNNVSTTQPTDDDFVKVSKDILGTTNERMINTIKDVYRRYDIAKFPAPPEQLLYCVRNCNFINKMLNNWRFQLFDIKYTDYRRTIGIPYIDLMLPPYQKQAGVVLQHKQGEILKCKFAIKRRHETPFEKVDKEPIYPEIQVPDLQQLYDEQNDDEDIEEIKWQLLFWILGIEPKERLLSAIRSVTQKYLVVVVLTIRHLLKSKAISYATADALLWTEFKTSVKDDAVNEDGREPVFPAKMNGRAIRNAHLYNIVRKMINDCMQTCGLSSFIEIPRFDGLLFHNTIEQFSVPYEFREKSLKEIEKFRLDV